MKNIAKRMYDSKVHVNYKLDDFAIQKDQDYANEKTTWIFEDGSAIAVDSMGDFEIISDYSLHKDNEKIRIR